MYCFLEYRLCSIYLQEILYQLIYALKLEKSNEVTCILFRIKETTKHSKLEA